MTRTRRWGRRLATILALGVVLLGVGGVGLGAWVEVSLHRSPVLAATPAAPGSGRGTTWLLVGSDSRAQLTPEQQAELTTGGDLGGGRTDTIVLVHAADPGSSAPTTMVSLPRDSLVSIPGHGADKINAAYAIGGAPLLAHTVEQATGLRLDHYLEVGFGGFAALVDALGGVRVCPADPISDPLAGIDLPAGCQSLDGPAALGFVRTRATPRADLDRMVNQRRFLAALLGRFTSPQVWANPARWFAVSRAALAALTVDDGDHVWDLGRLAWALRGPVTAGTVPLGGFTVGSAGAVVVWNHDAAGALFDALAADAPVPPGVFDEQP